MLRSLVPLLLILPVAVGFEAPPKLNKPQVGAPAPKLGLEKLLQAPKDAEVDWDALKGQVVVLEFWATWCGPCVGAIPHLNELAKEFEDKPVRFISVTDEKEAVIKKFLKKRSMRAWIGLDTDKSMHRAYGIRGIPTTFLVDKDGKIAAVTSPTQVTAKVLNELLAGKPLSIPTDDRRSGSTMTAGVEPGGDKKPALFEVTIRPAAEKRGGRAWGHGKMTAVGVELRSLLSFAYDILHTRIVDDAALGDKAYDVVVSTPEGQEAQLNSLLQQALEMTFGLKVRREQRETDVFLLKTGSRGYGKGLRQTVSTGGSSTNNNSDGFSSVNQPISTLASQLETLLKRPVLDKTRVDGSFDWELTCEDTDPQSIADAVSKQLGLRLIPAREPVEMLMVEKSAG